MKLLHSLRVVIFSFVLSFSANALADDPINPEVLKTDTPQMRSPNLDTFIFFSVLEGLYEDGLSNKDIDQVLMRNEGEMYFHFIYGCPLCTESIWAFETYRSRPDRFYALKSEQSTFGAGLSDTLREQLYSEDKNLRLIAINLLIKKWVEQRMNNLRLTEPERELVMKSLEKKRQRGMKHLKNWQSVVPGTMITYPPEMIEYMRTQRNEPDWQPTPQLAPNAATMAPAYQDLDECAVCNGTVGEIMKLQ